MGWALTKYLATEKNSKSVTKLTKIAPETTPTKMTNRRVDSASQNVGSVAKMTLFGHGA